MDNFVTINGREYKIPEMDFETVCQLEENGISLLGMNEKNPKIATMIRAFVAWIMDVPTQRASAEIQEHIRNGGNIMDLLTAITTALETSGFSRGNRQNDSVRRFPQDHKRSNRNRSKSKNRQSNTDRSQS